MKHRLKTIAVAPMRLLSGLRRGAVSLGARLPMKRAAEAVRALDVRAAHKVGLHVDEFDAKRRAFLKYAAFGGTLFLAGKYLNPIVNTLRGDTVIDEKVFRNFTLTETGKQLRVTDDEGSEILTIDKEGF